jgi:hypothetical protein
MNKRFIDGGSFKLLRRESRNKFLRDNDKDSEFLGNCPK